MTFVDISDVVEISDVEHYLKLYLNFEEVGSVQRAKAVVTLGNRWLVSRAESASNQSSSLSLGKSFVETMVRRATEYVAANATTAGGGSSRVRFLGAGASFR